MIIKIILAGWLAILLYFASHVNYHDWQVSQPVKSSQCTCVYIARDITKPMTQFWLVNSQNKMQTLKGE